MVGDVRVGFASGCPTLIRHHARRHARHGRYLIFFIEKGDEVQIVRVIEGSRDLPRLFER